MSPRRAQYNELVTYSQAHLRLKKDRGRPSNYECVACGGPAKEWAYMGGDPNEITDSKPRTYSLDQSRYSPMCVSCHRRHDRALADGRSLDYCPKGHEWTVENTGIRVKRTPSQGLRFCKACHREASRNRAPRAKAA